MQFKKNHTQRAMWIRNLLLDQRDVMLYAEIGQFPMRGEFCYSFFRQCEFFDLCEMDNKILVGDIHKVPVKKDDPSKYQFHFSIEELIEAQLERSSSS